MSSAKTNKLFLLVVTVAGCLFASLFMFTGWKEYRAGQEFEEGAELISSGKDIDKGLAIIESVIPELSKDAEFLRDYANILSRLGRKQEAIAVFERSLDAAFVPSVLINLSSLYLETGMIDKSIDYASQALSVLPWKLKPRFLLASAYFETGNREKACEFALQTITTPMKAPSDEGLILKDKARSMLQLCLPEEMHFDKEIREIISGINDPATRLQLTTALFAAGSNRAELEKALVAAAPERLDSLIFLLANMPERDSGSLDSSYLLENVECAHAVRGIWPFMPDIPEEIFLNYLLPYAQIGEERDNWRKDFMDHYLPIVQKCKSAGEVVLSLQTLMPNELNIQFDNDNLSNSFWSVGETIEKKLANCISLSVLVADACRSVGIPARVATIPRWKGIPGGHTWVEIYDQGTWRHIGAFEAYPLDKTWFHDRVAATDDSQFIHRIYGASFRRTDIQILRYGPDTWWTDITGIYKK